MDVTLKEIPKHNLIALARRREFAPNHISAQGGKAKNLCLSASLPKNPCWGCGQSATQPKFTQSWRLLKSLGAIAGLPYVATTETRQL